MKTKAILKLVIEKDAIILSGANTEEISPDNLQELENKLLNIDNILQDNLVRYIFQELLIQARTAMQVAINHADSYLL